MTDFDLDRLGEMFPGYSFERDGEGVKAERDGERTITEPPLVVQAVLENRQWEQRAQAATPPYGHT